LAFIQDHGGVGVGKIAEILHLRSNLQSKNVFINLILVRATLKSIALNKFHVGMF
jgi:hypothetical protein